MHKVLFVFIVVISGCKVYNSNSRIQYAIPCQVEERLAKELPKNPNEKIFFSLNMKNEDYVITVVKYLKKDRYKIDKFRRLENTNRFLLVKNDFYPLLFEFDYVFGAKLNKEIVKADICEKWENENFGIQRSYPLYDYSLVIIFTKNGDILKETYPAVNWQAIISFEHQEAEYWKKYFTSVRVNNG